jgi:hypothetical protein
MVGLDSAVGIAMLRAGSSGDLILVGERFSAPVQIGLVADISIMEEEMRKRKYGQNLSFSYLC